MWFISLLVLIFILGIIILVHEFGHFIWAKIFKVHIYEFSIGMGPIIFTHKGKDKVDYNIRAIPIGGFVSMAGEVYEDDEKIDKKAFMCNKPWYQRVIILVAGVFNNFLLAILILFISSLIWGGTINIPEVKDVVADMPMAEAGIVAGDKILEINGRKVSNWDNAQILLIMKSKDNIYDLKIEHNDGDIENIKVSPIVEKDEETGIETQVFGVYIEQETMTGLWGSIKYSFIKFGSIVNSMALTIEGLFTGKISIQALSGPVG
ncbi:MAG: site-2 protease family protein, partial [Bacilli bacterium]